MIIFKVRKFVQHRGLTPLGITLGAQVGLNTSFLAVIVVMAVLISAVAFGAIYWSTKHPEETDSHSLAKYEKYWVVVVLLILVTFAIVTSSYIPYPYAHSNVTPSMIVHVQAQQFSWCLTNSSYWGQPYCVSDYQIPVGNTVQFEVRSIDTTHGFGVYDPQGAIIFQVQVMPEFTNNITYTFSQAGTYYVRCLEFCGYGHYGMYTQFTVTS